MMIIPMLLFAAAPAWLVGPPTAEDIAAEHAFRACPGAEALAKTVTMSWKPLTGAIVRHRAIRAEQHLDFPEYGDRILLHAMDLGEGSERSVVGTRGADGIWHVDEAGQKELALAKPITKALPHKVYDLPVEESRRVDALLEDPCLYASPRFMEDRARPIGGAVERLEILTSGHQAVFGWSAVRSPAEEALVKSIVRD
jgi:hypothetical protein